MDCRTALAKLDEEVDRRLSEEERRRLDEHLVGCASCRRAADELERLMRAVEKLPVELDPPRDLWPGIAKNLSERPLDRTVVSRRSTASRWPKQALAALLWMSAGGLLVHLFLPVSVPHAPPAEVAAQPEEQTDEARLAALEVSYLRAKESLWLSMLAQSSEMSPELRAEVERNLLIIDQAIQELRRALALDPGNGQLEHLLLAQHRHEIDLLRRLAKASRDAA